MKKVIDIFILSTFLTLNAIATEPKLEFITDPTYSDDKNLLFISVGFKDVVFRSPYDYVGIYPIDDVAKNVFEHVPIQYKPAYPKHKKPKLELSLGKEFPLTKQSFLKFPTASDEEEGFNHVLNFTYVVRSGIKSIRLGYISGTEEYIEVAAVTPIIEIPDEIRFQPRHFRIALDQKKNQAVSYVFGKEFVPKYSIYWTEPHECRSKSKFYLKKEGHKAQEIQVEREFWFNSSSMCGEDIYPAASIGYTDLGVQKEVNLGHLTPGNYLYWVESETLNGVKSDVHEFSVPKPTNEPTNMIVFGDMGQSMKFIDGSHQHSFDNLNQGETAAPETVNLVDYLTSEKGFELINHIGDISYATGELALWDLFLHQIEKVSSRIPWLTGIGNHEIGNAESFVPGSDSQGECGAPYLSLFPFAVSTHSSLNEQRSGKIYIGEKEIENSQPFYSYIYKNVFVLMISTEHSFLPGSDQYQFIFNQLGIAQKMVEDEENDVNWILALGHRPMYTGSKSDYTVARRLKKHIEPLMIDFGVDLAIYGHHHSYQRMKCKIKEWKCDPNGVWQIISGHAGFDHSPLSSLEPEKEHLYAVRNNRDWGVSTLEFVNKTHLKVEYVENLKFEVLDSFWITK
eukprot:snap_masked-scaffold_10-processed-gene-4.35-mRNA-1 protein AED:1.00 eAED:1.00 QI:0/-1/0/0/-1/1/1/0/623